MEREPEGIVECTPWVDSITEDLILSLEKKTKSGKIKRMTIALNKNQVEEIIRIWGEE